MLELPHVFTSYQAQRYSGASTRQLRYWDQIGLVQPSVRGTGGQSGVGRLYSRGDLLLLKAIVNLLEDGRTLPWIRHKGGEEVAKEVMLLRYSETWKRGPTAA